MNRPATRRATMPAFALLALALLAGCAGPRTRLVEVVPGGYEMTKRSGVLVARPADLKVEVEQEALAFCAARGKGLAVVDSRAIPAEGPDYPSAFVSFRCA